MPLLECTGITNVDTNFTAWICLLSDEAEESYKWALTQFRKLLDDVGIPGPEVILSDFDVAFKNAAGVVFPAAKQQLCLWHIMKNVLMNIRKKWIGTLDGTRIGGWDTGEDAGTSKTSDFTAKLVP